MAKQLFTIPEHGTSKSAKNALINNEIKFPLVVKPRWGSASINIDFVEDEYELDLTYEIQLKRLKKTILFEASKDNINNAILIQEKINGTEYTKRYATEFEEF